MGNHHSASGITAARKETKADRVLSWEKGKRLKPTGKTLADHPAYKGAKQIREEAEGERRGAELKAMHCYDLAWDFIGTGSLVTQPVPEAVVVKQPAKPKRPLLVLLQPVNELQRIAEKLVAEDRKCYDWKTGVIKWGNKCPYPIQAEAQAKAA